MIVTLLQSAEMLDIYFFFPLSWTVKLLSDRNTHLTFFSEWVLSEKSQHTMLYLRKVTPWKKWSKWLKTVTIGLKTSLSQTFGRAHDYSSLSIIFRFYPTGPFTILELQDQEISVVNGVRRILYLQNREKVGRVSTLSCESTPEQSRYKECEEKLVLILFLYVQLRQTWMEIKSCLPE